MQFAFHMFLDHMFVKHKHVAVVSKASLCLDRHAPAHRRGAPCCLQLLHEWQFCLRYHCPHVDNMPVSVVGMFRLLAKVY